MLRLSVCVEMIFRDLPFLDRLTEVARAGYPAFEFWRSSNKDLPAIAQRAEELGLAVAAFVGSEGGPLVDPARRADFLAGLRAAVRAAQTLRCPTLIITVGQALPDRPRAEQHRSIVEGLRAAADIAGTAGLTLAVEPLNTKVNHPGYYLETSAEGFAIIDEVGQPNVRLLYDIYHMQIMEGNLTQTMTENLAKIAHIHVADVPGRHEPGTGEIHYPFLFRVLAEHGYTGYVGLEYLPLADAHATLAQVRAMLPTDGAARG